MGLLIPEDLPLSRLDRSERRVVQKLISGLRDSWIIIPRYDLSTPRRPYELDVLLVNDRVGVVGVEVKGGPVEIREGEWYRGNSPLRSPVRQAQDASYALRDRLR
ncbi:MAG: NERD domain-containing protein, partial [Acidimicrobiales bacterium]|nr:NERD domain-containing protein [Acidimicrobiales bacterium]